MKMGGTEPKQKTSIYLPDSVFWRLKEAAVAARISDTAAMETAIRLWLALPADLRMATDDAESIEQAVRHMRTETEEGIPASVAPGDMELAGKFLAWIRRPSKPGSVDEKLVSFVLKEINE